ncbi:MAG: AzlD domain-containing protein [Hyphomicrobiales bacterium]
MSWLNAPFNEWSPFLFILLAGAIPTQIWRWAGALLSRSIREDSEVLKWVKAVATALVAGLISKLVVFPSGALADIPVWARVGAMVVGYGVFFLTGPRIIFGIIAAELLLVIAGVIYI